ncbi:MAG: hypothetical protein ACFCUJ_01075 [Thiotrichales bacterium]
MNDQKAVLLLYPTREHSALGESLVAKLRDSGQAFEELVIDENYAAVLDAVAGRVIPVVVK